MVFKEHLREAHALMKREGFAPAIRKALAYFSRILYRRQEWHIYRNEMSETNGPLNLDMTDCHLRVISAPEELDEPLRGGFSIGPPFSMKSLRMMLAEHKVGFLIFKQRELAFWGWVAMGEGTRIYPPLKRIDYVREAYVCHALTSPRWRALGLHTHGSLKRLEYLKEKGKSRAIFATLKDNKPAVRVQEKIGSRICGEATLLRLLMCEFWTEKWYDGR